MKLFKSHELNMFQFPIEMDWRGYWREADLDATVETAGNARL
jgi:hypothetical protein